MADMQALDALKRLSRPGDHLGELLGGQMAFIAVVKAA